MKQLNLGRAHDRLLPQQREAINLVFNIREAAPAVQQQPGVPQAAPGNCGNCGAPLSPTAAFCTYCGKPAR